MVITGPFLTSCGERPGKPSQAPEEHPSSSAQVCGTLLLWEGLGHRDSIAAVAQGCSVSSCRVFALILFYKSNLGLWPPRLSSGLCSAASQVKPTDVTEARAARTHVLPCGGWEERISKLLDQFLMESCCAKLEQGRRAVDVMWEKG